MHRHCGGGNLEFVKGVMSGALYYRTGSNFVLSSRGGGGGGNFCTEG